MPLQMATGAASSVPAETVVAQMHHRQLTVVKTVMEATPCLMGDCMDIEYDGANEYGSPAGHNSDGSRGPTDEGSGSSGVWQ